MIIRSCERMFAIMRNEPYAYVMSGDYKKLSGPGNKGAAGKSDHSIHRTFFESDFRYFCSGLYNCYKRHESLETIFASAANVWEGMVHFRETMAQGNKALYSKHIADANSFSACKRLNLALRWLVRKGPVDLCVWKKISPASLYIPLDLHVGRVSRQLGLLDPGRKSNDKKAVLTLTEKLREFCPGDPVKYDFALFGMGVAG